MKGTVSHLSVPFVIPCNGSFSPSVVGYFVMEKYMKGVLQDGRTEECKA